MTKTFIHMGDNFINEKILLKNMFAFILPMLTKNILNMLDIVNLLIGLINIFQMNVK